MNVNFIKMQGLGNDFVVIDAIDAPVNLSPSQIQKLADRRRGVGCDQLLVVDRQGLAARDDIGDDAFNYRIYNADGSESAQCGNGARCVTRYLIDTGHVESSCLLLTADDRLQASANADGSITVDMGKPRFAPADVPLSTDCVTGDDPYELDIDGRRVTFGAVSMGNPHAVLTVDDVVTAPVETLGPVLESHRAFPERVNVGFAQIVSRNEIRLRVYERGVGETEACGSGACAAMAVARRRDQVDSRCSVVLSGGLLHIEWNGKGSVLMTGPADTVFNGTIDV